MKFKVPQNVDVSEGIENSRLDEVMTAISSVLTQNEVEFFKSKLKKKIQLGLNLDSKKDENIKEEIKITNSGAYLK